MGNEWQWLPFDAAVEVNPTTYLKRGKDYPFVEMAAVEPASKDVTSVTRRVFSGGGSRFRSGDTLMARITPCLENGKIARFLSLDGEVGHGSTEFIIIRGRDDVTTSEFAYYLTKWERVRRFAIGQMTGSTGRQRVPVNALANIEVPVPPLPEQRAIAHILGSLDDKIELNRQMNRTLEEIARALFKSWFVDFDPVHAKARGEQPAGLDAATAALFPAEFEDSALGPIPAGWRAVSILDFAERLSGGTPKTSVAEYWNGDIAWVSARDVKAAEGTFIIDTEKHISSLGVENSSTRILPKGTTIVTARGTVGAYCMLAEEMAMNQTNYGLKSRTDFGDHFVFLSLGNAIAWLQQNTHGTIFDTITTQTLERTNIVLPPERLIRTFEVKIGPVMELAKSNIYESRTLAELRDTLLPKLMSGELRVPEAMERVEDSA